MTEDGSVPNAGMTDYGAQSNGGDRQDGSSGAHWDGSAPLLPDMSSERGREAGADGALDDHAGETHSLPLQAGPHGQQWRDYSEVGVDLPLKF